MKYLLEQRHKALVAEQRKGRQTLAELDDKRARLGETLLRIEGAITVLHELLAEESSEGRRGDAERENPLRQVSA